jgi:hypothetical protein
MFQRTVQHLSWSQNTEEIVRCFHSLVFIHLFSGNGGLFVCYFDLQNSILAACYFVQRVFIVCKIVKYKINMKV